MQAILDTCNAGSSGMVKCPNIPGGFTDDGECHIDNLVPETIFGKMSSLPGSNPIGKWGVAAGTPVASGTTTKVADPTTSKAVNPSTTLKTTTKAVTTTPKVDAPVATTTKKVDPVTTTKATPVPTTTKAVGSSTKPGGVVVPSKSSTTKTPVVTSAPVDGPKETVTQVVTETETVVVTVTLPLPAATQTVSVSGWTYTGCYLDKTERVLTGVKFANIGNKQVTSSKCASYCEAKGFSIAGTEYGGQCFCGNKLVGSKQLSETQCNMPCEGNAKETCGGPDALSVYTKAKAKRSVGHMHRHLHAHE